MTSEVGGMKTGDSFQDAQGGAWQLGQLLGRGLWGKSYAARRESDDTVFVLKCALGPEDFRGEPAGAEQVFAACREAVLEVARVYGDGRSPFLPRLEARVTLPNGTPGFLVPRLPDSLERRIQEGITTASLLDAALAAVRLVRQLPSGWHGALRPSNLLFNERGELFLSDPVTPAVQRALPLLLAATPTLAPSYPPEVAEQPDRWGPQVDTWSTAMWLWRGAMSGAPAPAPPRAGLDKSGQVALRDRVQDRLKAEDANPRFHARVAERYAVLLSRALSREASPSPPFRFPQLEEFAARVEEVGSLIRPQVTSVGKVLVDRPASKPYFDTDEAVSFACTVACTAGVEGPEEIGVGIAVFDIDRDERLKNLDLAYTVDKHPGSGPGGGRYRFGFKITGLAPGRFRARLAFAIRDSGQAPATTEVEYNVMPAPGWVPRPEAALPEPLAFPKPAEEPTRTTPGTPAPEPAETNTGVTAAGARRIPVPAPATPPRPVAAPAKPVVAPAKPVARAPLASPGARAPLASPSPSPSPRGPAPDPIPRPAPVARVPSAGESRPIASPTAPVPADAGPRVSPAIPLAPAAPALPVAPPVVAAPPSPAPVIEEEEPVWQPRGSWADEPLPLTSRAADPVPEEEIDDLEPEPEEPGVLSRVIEQLRTDPYLAVMAGLGSVVVVLLIIFLLLR